MFPSPSLFVQTITSMRLWMWNRYVDYKKMKGLLKPLENFKGTSLEEAEFVSALYAEIEKVSKFDLHTNQSVIVFNLIAQVDNFFTAKESEFFAEFRVFCIQVFLARQADLAYDLRPESIPRNFFISQVNETKVERCRERCSTLEDVVKVRSHHMRFNFAVVLILRRRLRRMKEQPRAWSSVRLLTTRTRCPRSA
jgi:hypothetical protein